jgi:hypothetical protein
VEIRKSTIRGQPRKNIGRPPSQQTKLDVVLYAFIIIYAERISRRIEVQAGWGQSETLSQK